MITHRLSEICLACLNGDVDLAGSLIATLQFTDINRIEPNRNTALHAMNNTQV